MVVTKPNYESAAYDLIMTAKQKFVGEVLVKRARQTPNRIACEFKGKTVTFKELNTEVNKLANGLMAIGIKRGDVIACIFRNRIESITYLYAAAKIGAIVCMMNWRYTEREMTETINHVLQPVLAVSSEKENEKVENILKDCPTIKQVIYLDTPLKCSLPTYSQEEVIAKGTDVEPNVELHEEDILYIVFTSGTTGIPKGAAISQRAEIQRIKSWVMNFGQRYHADENDHLIARGPFYHVTSVAMTLGAHALGAKSIILDGFTPADMIDIYEKEKILWGSMDPSMIERFSAEAIARGADLSLPAEQRKWRVAGVKVCGAMLDVAPSERLKVLSLTMEAPMLNTYGQTEIGLENFSYGTLPKAEVDSDAAALYADKGKEENFDPNVRLVNSNGEDVPEGEPGELVIRTPMMFSGYFRNDATNLEDFRDGWFHTGDVLRRRPEDAKYDFVSRVKYMIKPGGENVYPAEIERVFLAHPMVRDCAVVGAKHPKWNETPVAFVALVDDAIGKITGDELRAYCKANLSGFKVPSRVVIRPYEDFKFNETGKYDRNLIESWLPDYFAANPWTEEESH